MPDIVKETEIYINNMIKKANDKKPIQHQGRGIKQVISDNRIAVLGKHKSPIIVK